MKENIIRMEGMEKSFSENRVLKNVDFFVKKGSIHALLGENGTGKSTLMNLLGGVYHKDSGDIYIEGKKVEINSPRDASELGIAFIHQEFKLIPDLNVYENMFLGHETKKYGFILDKKAMIEETERILDVMKTNINPTTLVKELSAAYQQIVEIACALVVDAKYIIMDEPTTSLTDTEIKIIFEIMRGLQQHDVTFVFISHKLNEVVEICDAYTIMRDGRVVDTSSSMEGVTEKYLATQMVGKELSTHSIYKENSGGEVILETKNLSLEGQFKNINITLKKGEIIGITGLLGDGRSRLMETIFGVHKGYTGEIFIKGKLVKMKSTHLAAKLGISYLPRNRKENAVIPDVSIKNNMTISMLEKIKSMLIIDGKKENFESERMIDRFNIRIQSTEDLIGSLSGGNQQKSLLARALGASPEIVILDNPTQGVDVGAKAEIYDIIDELSKQGVSFVILSSEAQEVMMLSDRIYVMFEGEVMFEYGYNEATAEHIMLCATGGIKKA